LLNKMYALKIEIVNVFLKFIFASSFSVAPSTIKQSNKNYVIKQAARAYPTLV